MNLTTLQNVKQWVGSTSTTDDDLIRRLIAEASRTVLNYVQRPDLGFTTLTEVISGRGERKLQLRNWPVIAVNSLTINSQSVPASTGPTIYGYLLEADYGSISGSPQSIGITGIWESGMDLGGGVVLQANGMAGFAGPYAGAGARPFPRGIGNIAVNYSFGYCIQNEPQTVSANSPNIATPYAPYGSWSGDNGVTYANGSALIPVASNPTTGQYVPPTAQTGESIYIFSSGDANAGVLLNYNYVPYDVEQACIEVAAERYRYRSRIGQISQSLGGQETASYLVKDALTAAIQGRLDPYRLTWLG